MLDVKEERQYEQLRRLGQELHLPIPEAFWTLEVFDKDGQSICPKCSFPAIKGIRSCPNCGAEIRHHQRSHSWVRNAYNLMFVQLAGKGCTGDGFGAGKVSVKQTDTTIYDVVNQAVSISGTAKPDDLGKGYRENAAMTGFGILVGSGVNAEDFEDYVLQTPIAEGAGAGQLNHAQSEANAYSYGALVGTNTLIRYFNNNSGGAIDVNEVALVGYIYCGSSGKNVLMSRDHLASTVTVPDTGQLKVTYTVQLTYPA